MSLADRLTLLAEHAPSLRVAGITKLAIDGIELELAPHTPVSAQDFAPPQSQHSSDPLYDSSTYAGGQVPGYNLDTEPAESDA